MLAHSVKYVTLSQKESCYLRERKKNWDLTLFFIILNICVQVQELIENKKSVAGWVDGWVDGWMDGWIGGWVVEPV